MTKAFCHSCKASNVECMQLPQDKKNKYAGLYVCRKCLGESNIGICRECWCEVDITKAVKISETIFECKCGYPNSLGDLGLKEPEQL